MATGKYVLVIDAGSSSCRALLFDGSGSIISSAYRTWEYDAPADVAPLGRQFSPAGFWNVICQVTRESIDKAGVTLAEIAAVSAASQRQGLVFLDRDGVELYGGPNTDLRALMEGFAIDAAHGEALRRITGHSPAFLFAPAKLQWFKANRPGVHDRIATMLTISNWIVYRLSGRCVAEPTADSDTGLVDIGSSCWSSELQKTFGLAREICPEMTPAGTCIGAVTADAAGQTGLAQGTPVVVGGADTQCGLLGMGVIEEGQVGVVAGWSAAIQMVTDKPIVDSTGKIWSSCHILPGRWVLESNAAEAGGAYAWLSRLLLGGSPSGEDTYALMDRLAGEAPVGSGGVLSHIGPRAMDMTRLKPLMGGFLFPITPTVTEVGSRGIIRAALENLSFAIKANCLQLEETSHLKMRSLSVGGGLARSQTLGRILADVLAMPVEYHGAAEVTSHGAAMCAGVGVGMYPDLVRAGIAMRSRPRLISPDRHAVQEYSRCYEKWLKAVKWLDTLSEEMM